MAEYKTEIKLKWFLESGDFEVFQGTRHLEYYTQVHSKAVEDKVVTKPYRSKMNKTRPFPIFRRFFYNWNLQKKQSPFT